MRGKKSILSKKMLSNFFIKIYPQRFPVPIYVLQLVFSWSTGGNSVLILNYVLYCLYLFKVKDYIRRKSEKYFELFSSKYCNIF